MKSEADCFGTKVTTNEERNWLKRIRRKRTVLLVLFITYIPVVAVLDLMSGLDLFAPSIALGYLLIFSGLGLSLAFAKCIKCKKLYFTTWLWANPFTRKCLHCGFGQLE